MTDVPGAKGAPPSDAESRGERRMLRHTLATLSYRAEKALRNAPATFAEFRIGDQTRTPAQILSHLGALLDWGLHLAKGEHVWQETAPLPWDAEVARFFSAVAAFDAYLSSDQPLGSSAGRLFQGPIADALTHVGQINMLRRLAGSPVRGENYAKAEITPGQVTLAPGAKRFEFD